MTEPAAKAVAKKVAPKAGPKKLAQTRAANPSAPAKTKPLPSDKGGSLPAKKTAVKVISGTKKTAKKAYSGSFDSKFAPRQRPEKSVVTYRHILAFEFWLGLIFILTRPEKSKVKENELIQAASFIFMMAVLFGISALGRQAAKLASALGGLVVLVLLMFDMTDGRFGAITTDPNPPLSHTPVKEGPSAPGQRKPVT